MVKIIRSLARRIKGFFYAIPFAMKAGDELLATSNKGDNNGTSIVQKKEAKSVWNDLLNQHVTQEVEELRYSTYKAEEESMNYTYLGNGQAIRKEESLEEKRKKRQSFVQPNLNVEYNSLEAMELAKKNNINLKEKHLIEIHHKNPNAKFKFDSYIDKVGIGVNEEGYYTELYFPIINGDRNRRPLINALKIIYKEIDSGIPFNNAYKEHHELVDGLEELKFTTYKASNNIPNGIEYDFKKGDCISIAEHDEYMMLRFQWDEFYGGKLLSEKYYSESQDKKYKNKEKKENYKPTISI